MRKTHFNTILMDKWFSAVLTAILMSSTSVAQIRDSINLDRISGDTSKVWRLYLDSSRIQLQELKRNQVGYGKQKVLIDTKGRANAEADRVLLDKYMRDSVRTINPADREKLRTAFRNVTGIRLDEELAKFEVKVFEDSIEIGEGVIRSTFALNDSVSFNASVRKIFGRSPDARQTMEKLLSPSTPAPADEGFPIPMAVAALSLGILLGGAATFLMVRSSRRPSGRPHVEKAVPKESLKDSAPIETASYQSLEIPPSIAKLLETQLAQVMSGKDAHSSIERVGTEDALNKILERCVTFIKEVVRERSQLHSEVVSLKKQLDENQVLLSSSERQFNETKGRLEKVQSEIEAQQKELNQANLRCQEFEKQVNNLQADEKSLAAISEKVRGMLDDLYRRLEGMAAEKLPNEAFEADVLRTFITVAVVSLSHFSIRSGKNLDADNANIDLLEGRPAAKPAMRVDAATSRSSVDPVSYFVYRLLKAHNVSGIGGFNYMGYTIGP